MRISRSWTVARPSDEGLISTKTSPFTYLRVFGSGLVETEKMGCSILAMSPRGDASKISQTKKSGVGWRSGRRGERFSAEEVTSILGSIFHTPFWRYRYFTHQARSFDISPTNLRRFTHPDSIFHPPGVLRIGRSSKAYAVIPTA